MNKKGFIYVISAGLIIAVMLIVFFSQQDFSFEDETSAELRRVTFADDFVKGFNQDFERVLSIATFRTLIALEEHIAVTGNFLNSTEDYFAETIYHGTIEGVPATIMVNSSISEYLSRVNIIGTRFGLEVEVIVEDILLSQSNPWHVDVVVLANVSIRDNSNIASWHFLEEYVSHVPIINLRDPLYAVFTQNRVYNSIRQSPINLTEGDVANNLNIFIEDSYYVESNYAPSFIQRFSNDTTPNGVAGIESVVNILKLSDQNIDIYPARIKVDYMYFNNINDTKICDFIELDDKYNLVLPDNRNSIYNLNDLNYSSICP